MLTGAATADQQVPEDKTAAVLAAFSTSLPGQKLPFGLAPTSEGARGSDIIIEGIAEGVTIALDGFSSHEHFNGRGDRRAIAALGVACVIGRLLTLRAGLLNRPPRPIDGGHHRPGVVAHRADRGAFQCGVVRSVRRGAAGGQSGVSRTCPSVAHVEIDMDANPAAARRLSVLSLPTTFIFDPDGRQRYRTAGVPKAADLRSALEPLLA